MRVTPRPAAGPATLDAARRIAAAGHADASRPPIRATWGNALQVAVVPGSAADRFNLVVREVVTANGEPVLGSNGLPQVRGSETTAT